MGRTSSVDELVFRVVRFLSFKNLVYLIIFAFALPLLIWIFVAKDEPSMDFGAAMAMQVKFVQCGRALTSNSNCLKRLHCVSSPQSRCFDMFHRPMC